MADSQKTTGDGTQKAASRYANILMDSVFKRTFGTEINKRIMILFLQEIIPEAHVEDITYSNKEHQNPFPDGHGAVIDVEAVSKDGFRFMPVYFIGLMDFTLHSRDSAFRYNYCLTECRTGETMSRSIQFIFLELPKVKAIGKESSNVEKLCYALHNMKVLKSRPPEMAAEIFTLLFDSAEISKFTPEEKIKYDNDMTTARDIRNQIAYGREQGRAEGFAEAQTKAEEEKRQIAKSLLGSGISPELIARSFGIDVADLKGK